MMLLKLKSTVTMQSITNCISRRTVSLSAINSNLKKDTHYTALGLKETASQSEVKAAYYRLSKLYHPDTNQGKTDDKNNLKQFQNITAAYEVLGNVKSRKMYDLGLPFARRGGVKSPFTPRRDAASHFYQAQRVRRKASEPVYDFDEWTREHYGDRFRKHQEHKQRVLERDIFHEQDHNNKSREQVMIVLMFFTIGYLLTFAQNSPYDNPVKLRNDKVLNNEKQSDN